MPRKNTSPTKVTAAIRRVEVMRLRMTGLTYEEIGRRVGISNVAAYNHVKHALEHARTELIEVTDTVREQELRRLDRALVVVMAAMTPRNRARPGPNELAAVDRLIKIMERRAKYLGLDAPTQFEHAAPGGAALLAPVIMLPDEDPADDETPTNGVEVPGGAPGVRVANGHGSNGRSP